LLRGGSRSSHVYGLGGATGRSRVRSREDGNKDRMGEEQQYELERMPDTEGMSNGEVV